MAQVNPSTPWPLRLARERPFFSARHCFWFGRADSATGRAFLSFFSRRCSLKHRGRNRLRPDDGARRVFLLYALVAQLLRPLNLAIGSEELTDLRLAIVGGERLGRRRHKQHDGKYDSPEQKRP